MKKHLLLVLVVAIICLLSTNVLAGKLETNFVGGITYNTYSYSYVNSDGTVENPTGAVSEALRKGPGFYAGTEIWVTNWLAVAAGVDYATASYSESQDGASLKLSSSLIGPYSGLEFRFANILKLHSSMNIYSHTENLSISVNSQTANQDLTKGYVIGFLAGGQLAIPVNKECSIVGDVSYRIANVQLTQAYDFDSEQMVDASSDNLLNLSGLRFSLGISYKY